MKKDGWLRFIFGLLLTATIGCAPPSEENEPNQSLEPIAVATASVVVAQQATATQSTSNSQNPPPVSESPTAELWQQVGSEATGLQFSIPPAWRNLTDQLTTVETQASWGETMLLVADNDRTGAALLGGKTIDKGAFVAGAVTNFALPTENAVDFLTQALQTIGGDVTPISDVRLYETAETSYTVATVDVLGSPLPFTDMSEAWQSRLLLFLPNSAETAVSTSQTLFFLTAPQDSFSQFEAQLNQIAATIRVHRFQNGFVVQGDTVNFAGQLLANETVANLLQPSIADAWTFTIEQPQYANLTLSPGLAAMDLRLTLFSPSGQTVARLDNGFAGSVETAIDLLLSESGTYVVQIDEFFGASGSYSLTIGLSDERLFGGGGSIFFGQGIQSVLPENGQQAWAFSGEAGQAVNIVLTPDDDVLDLILDLYAPDGTRLVALDEGFSGDPEVIAGYLLPDSGQYSILVRSFAGYSGSYNLTLDEGGETTLSFFDAGNLRYGDVAEETLQPNEAHAWFFNGRSGDEIRVEVVPLSSELDLEIWLLNPEVERLVTQDEALAGIPESFEAMLPVDGQFLLLVRDFNGQPGQYEIRLNTAAISTPLVAGTLSYGETVSGGIESNQQLVWEFTAVSGDIISIELQQLAGSNRDLLFMLQAPSGRIVADLDNALAGGTEILTNFVLDENGRYSIILSEFFNDPAQYQLSLSQTP